VWTRLGLHGIDDSDPDNPKIIHAFLPRDAGGFEVKENWDVMGMRATQSHDTLLDAAFVPDKYIVRVLDEGMKGAGILLVKRGMALPGSISPVPGRNSRLHLRVLNGR